ncbi:hypothetical protein EW093_09505 [Thiospirochaeta perfilievii]|uniref:Uncharacterized protein n=1 Tax=Thiospirochaeta perfilievii TaxID=252967 RepID=A0A5C1Q9X6_9SPIO|nr:hypothetical protein [Thiospirochaeta perfilievii]QEN04933.1 hypothetical protein EW093_09505 [Thiospirochaeta perfilievii]
MLYRKSLIIPFFFIFIIKVFSFDSSISLKEDFNYILSLKNSDFEADIYKNSISATTNYIDKDFELSLTLFQDNFNGKINNMDVEKLDYFTINSDTIEAKFNKLTPKVTARFLDSWISLSYSEGVDLSFLIDIPINNIISIGSSLINSKMNNSISLFDSYTLLINPEWSGFSFFFKTRGKKIDFNLSFSKKDLILKPEKSNNEIGFNINLTSDYSLKLKTQLNFNRTKLSLSATQESYSFGIKKQNIFMDREIFGGTTTDSKISISKIGLESSIKNLSLGITQDFYTLDSVNLFMSTEHLIKKTSFLYYRRIFAYLPNITLYNSGFKSKYIKQTKIGNFDFSFKYNRLYTNFKGFNYFYKNMSFSLFPKTLYISPLTTYDFNYNHLNIVNISISHNIKLKNNIEIETNLNQILPFFDFSRDSINNIANEITGSSAENYIRGGLSFSLQFTFAL